MDFGSLINNLLNQMAFFHLEAGNYIMIAVALFFLWLAIKKGFEPLLLIPISFGMLLVNIYPDIMYSPEEASNGTGGLLWYFFQLDAWSILPSLIFMGVGAMTDFGPLIANPISFLMGAAAQLGIYAAYFLAILLGFSGAEAAAISIIGGADGPTSILVSDQGGQAGTPADVQDEIMLIQETPAEDAAEGPDQDHQLTYIALGDSIAAGVGLDGFNFTPAEIFYDISPNFKGYPDSCYVSYVAEMLGLDRDHALDLGLPALMTKDLLEMVRDGQMSEFNQPAGTYYVYPAFRDYLKEADVISIQIGMNDAMVPFVVSIGNATNWKSEQLANTIVSGGYRDMNWDTFVQMAQQLFGMRLTMKETGDLFYALTTGAAQVCNTAYDNMETYLPQIIDAIRALNPDAQILLLGCYNPVPLLWTWSNFFNRYNRFVRNLAEETGCTYVPIPRTRTANDGHPTTAGHRYIAEQIVEAIDTAA